MTNRQEKFKPHVHVARDTSSFQNFLITNKIQSVINGTTTLSEILGMTNKKKFKELENSIELKQYCTISDELPILQFTRSTTQINRSYQITASKTTLPRSASALAAYYKSVPRSTSLRDQCGFRYRKRPNDVVKTIRPLEDQIIRVRIYRPLLPYRTSQKIHQEFIVLGSNYLMQLRDKIFCICNYGPLTDISKNLTQDIVETPRTDPGFFFINDTFYNDMRHKDNEDYSLKVWNELEHSPEDRIKTATMEGTKFSELSFILGATQVYRHRGNCEHTMVFADVRLISGDDPRTPTFYPILEKAAASVQKNCDVCAHTKPEYYVVGSNRHIQDPAILCEVCYMACHFVDGKKQGNFETYRYFDSINAVDFDLLGCDDEDDGNCENIS